MYSNQYDLTYSDLNPTILFASKQKVLKDGVYHNHDFTEMTYMLSGKGRYIIEGNTYEVGTGDIIMCNPGVMHQNIQTDFKEGTVQFFTGFSDFHFKNMQVNCIELKDGAYIMHSDAEFRQELSEHCYAMAAENESSQAGKYFMLKAHLMQILLLIVREITGIQNQPKQLGCNFESYNKNYVVKRIITYLNEHFEEKISLDRIAHNMYLSPVYISKMFKEETGESPINYLIKIRLERAKEDLLKSDNNSIKNIAKSVGYEDVYHFSKLFKKYYGVSPLYYKKMKGIV